MRDQNKFKDQKDVDCQQELTSVQKKIKVINQLLDRLIPESDEHTVLTEKKVYDLEVIEQTLMSYKIPCKNCLSPAKFVLAYEKAKKGKQSKEKII